MVVINSPEHTQSGVCLAATDYGGEDDTTNYQQSPHSTSRVNRALDCHTALNDKTIGLIVINRHDKLSALGDCNFNDTVFPFVPLGVGLGAGSKCALVAGQEQRDDPGIVQRVCVATHEVEQITVEILSAIPAIHGKSNLLGHAWQVVPSMSHLTLISRRQIKTHPSVHDPRQDTDGVHFVLRRVVIWINKRYAAGLDIEPPRNAFKPKNKLGILHRAACAEHPANHTSFRLLDRHGRRRLNYYYTVLLVLDGTLGVVYCTHICIGEEATMTVLSYA
ncbi:hypothetical protein B0H19DRAFT_1260435 [Mycena capillaripes]|nr:hypothetical protein B0H19DRAFT_1260435 [Mycena capillaripes]